MPSLDQVIVWVIVGLLGGSLAGLVITRERKGFGVLRNLGMAWSALLSVACYSACSGFSPDSTGLLSR
jgi:uncharacterized membrane protein YeaQ/YmgE (transglycosylase-associated protein family)